MVNYEVCGYQYNQETAGKIMHGTIKWLKERLHLEISNEKTRITNTKKQYMEFLGFKIGLYQKKGKYVTYSHVSDKAVKRIKETLKEQAKRIAIPRKGKTQRDEVLIYNAMVMGVQNYYKIATCISADFRDIQREIMAVLTNRLTYEKETMLVKNGRKLSKIEQVTYGQSNMLRYVAGIEEPIYPIGYVKFRIPAFGHIASRYTKDGRLKLHDEIGINTNMLYQVMKTPSYGRSIEYMDNRISLFSSQMGKCAITNKVFLNTDEIHCHHKIPKENGGTDEYQNLIIINKDVHRLIHATDPNTIKKYLEMLKLSNSQKAKVNQLRKLANNAEI